MIMRYQRISPESEAVNNGRRTNSPSNQHWKICKEDEDKVETTYNNWYMKTGSTTFEGKGISSRFRSPSKISHQEHQNGYNSESPNSPPNTSTSTASNSATNQQNIEVVGDGSGGGGETFLQWGHRKRSRCSRGIITMADDTTSSSSTSGAQIHPPPAKIQRKLSPNNVHLMPPPSIPSTSSPNGIHQTGTTPLKSQARNISSYPSPSRRNQLEERSQSGAGNRSITGRSRAVKRTPTPTPSSSTLLAKDEKKIINGCSLQLNQAPVNSDRNNLLSPPQLGGCSSSAVINDYNNSDRVGKIVAGATATAGVGGGGGEVVQWPRIYIPLSKKEKEEDFLAIKGTKLPYRPKKRPKAIEKVIQYCYPGMWLPELTKSRYEVREKKSSKKQKRRGLKGMENMESDSE